MIYWAAVAILGVALTACNGLGDAAPAATPPTAVATTVPVATVSPGHVPATLASPSASGVGIVANASSTPATAPVATRPSVTALGQVTLTPRQAQEVAVFMRFLQVYNTGQLDETLAVFAEDVTFSDCDYGQGIVQVIDGKPAVARWLRQRFADHDQLELSEILLGGENGLVMAVSYTRCTSDTLRSLGFPEGITPHGATKVVFDYLPGTRTGTPRAGVPRGRITFFQNGPVGAPPERSCGHMVPAR